GGVGSLSSAGLIGVSAKQPARLGADGAHAVVRSALSTCQRSGLYPIPTFTGRKLATRSREPERDTVASTARGRPAPLLVIAMYTSRGMRPCREGPVMQAWPATVPLAVRSISRHSARPSRA